MRFGTLAALFVGAVCLSSSAFAMSSDDRKWINQCLKDNGDAKVSATIVAAYCACMNDKMSENETRSITEWEKSNPSARKACERSSGWD